MPNLLLLKGAASGAAAATLGITFSLTGLTSGAGTVGVVNTLTAPPTFELSLAPTFATAVNVTATPFVTLAGTATEQIFVGHTARGGFSNAATMATTLGISATVGGTLDGIASIANTLGVTAAGRVNSTAAFGAALNITGLPNISGGTLNSAATPALVLGVTSTAGFREAASLRHTVGMTATGNVTVPVATPVGGIFFTLLLDQIRLNMATTVNEGSRLPLSMSIRDGNNAPLIVSTLRYRVDCKTTGRMISDWASLTPAATVSLTIPATSNAILNSWNRYETKEITVEANAGTADAFVKAQSWQVRNIFGKT